VKGDRMSRAKKKSALCEFVQVDMKDVLNYQRSEIGDPFIIKLKTPNFSDRFNDDHRHYTKSNINVCYAMPRSEKYPREWYETQMTVSKHTRAQQGYPNKGIPFYAVTDDGFGFLAHTTSQDNKQFAALGDELILGKWIKGRLVDEGLVEPIAETAKDIDRQGMITSEMLERYGCNAVAFQKTDKRIYDPDYPNESYEVWTLKLVKIDAGDH
jgi:hypothetical protein